MKKVFYLLVGLLILGGNQIAKADEGMWIPALITDNYEEMKRLGLELTPEQIYDINNSSLKDAIVRLGRGFCTGEIISDQGLVLTNHHCGYDAIQKLSSTTANHLKNGFWAKSHKEELPAGFSVAFLVKIVEVTNDVLDGVTADMDETARHTIIAANSKKISDKFAEDKTYDVDVKEFYSGNKYYAYVYQTFNDVRLVGTPPESVGKYGGDTDNWMWPRHTGDFSMFRVYANKDNKPADYSVDNVPYKPKHHLPVSMKGVEKGDFAMIWGFPGSTDRYLTSYGVKLAVNIDQPSRVKLRRARLDIFEKYQMQSEEVDLMYSSKHARVSNYWKYFIGQTAGLQKLGVYEKKKQEEEAFTKWVNSGDAARKAKYGNVLSLYESAYEKFDKFTKAQTYLEEAALQVEILRHGFSYSRLVTVLESLKEEKDEEKIKELESQRDELIASITSSLESTFKDYYEPIDREVAVAMFTYYMNDIPEDQRPDEFNKCVKQNKGDIDKMVSTIFNKSALDSKESAMALLESLKLKKMKKDPAIMLAGAFINFYFGEMQAMFGDAEAQREKADRLYKAALFEMYPDKAFSPNANSTMRFSYGQVLDYSPGDAMLYKHFTTMAGVIEKYKKDDHEFDLPDYYLTKAMNQDYGQYAKDGEDLHICFLTNNDITGGNSGSPVINGKGQLIGLAFDGNWEAMSGDIAFEPDLQRTISVDIRYVLWCIDKLAGAGHIVDEMTLVK